MNDYATNPNDIDAFATLIRDALPHVIEDGTDRAVMQTGDEELMAWTCPLAPPHR